MSNTTFLIVPPVKCDSDPYSLLTGIAAVVADTQSLAAEREMPSHRANLTLGYNRVVYMQFEPTIRLVVLAHPFFSELDDDVLAGRGCGGGDTLFRRNAEDVVAVGDLAVFHIECVPAWPTKARRLPIS